MSARYLFTGFIITAAFVTLTSCGDKPAVESTHFTKADSVTETYLMLKESMLETWNSLVNDDNQKLKAMQNLIHELKVSSPSKREELIAYEERLQHLINSRFTEKSMSNPDVIEEYDFASNALVSELVAVAESQPQFAYNSTLQALLESIRTAEQRVENYRVEYDRIASEYNAFLDENAQWLKDADDGTPEKKPLFRMVSDDEASDSIIQD